MVAFGKATPLTTTVVGLMSVTGMKLGVVVVEPKTKICKLAGVVALMLNGANGVPTPIWVVTELLGGIGTVIRPPSTIWAPPALDRVDVLSDVVARRADDEVALIVGIGGEGRGLQPARNRGPEEVGRAGGRAGRAQQELDAGERGRLGRSRARMSRSSRLAPGSSTRCRLDEFKPGAPIKISLGWPELMKPTGETDDPARSPACAPMRVTDRQAGRWVRQRDRAGEECARRAGGPVEQVGGALNRSGLSCHRIREHRGGCR